RILSGRAFEFTRRVQGRLPGSALSNEADMHEPAIEIHELRKRFRTRVSRGTGARARLADLVAPRTEWVPAVDGISLRIEAGERVAFIGPNGAGKSTTLKMLAGIVHPDSGMATVDGLVP